MGKKVLFRVTFRGWNEEKIDRSYGEMVLTIRKKCLNGEHLKVPVWP